MWQTSWGCELPCFHRLLGANSSAAKWLGWLLCTRVAPFKWPAGFFAKHSGPNIQRWCRARGSFWEQGSSCACGNFNGTCLGSLSTQRSPLQAGYSGAGSGAGARAGDGMWQVGRRWKDKSMPVSARHEELDLLRPHLAALQHQV